VVPAIINGDTVVMVDGAVAFDSRRHKPRTGTSSKRPWPKKWHRFEPQPARTYDLYADAVCDRVGLPRGCRGANGRAATLDNGLSGAGSFGLARRAAARIIEELVMGVRTWRNTFGECGVSARVRHRTARGGAHGLARRATSASSSTEAQGESRQPGST